MTRVSIGIPVRNGAADLERALASVLRQTHPDVEIVLSDNDSSDATPEICRRYVETYPNVRYVRQDRLLTFEQNVLQTITHATGEYYAFMGHDDELDERYVENLAAALDRDPKAVLAGCGLHLQYKGGEFIDIRFTGTNALDDLGFASQALVFATKRALRRPVYKPNLFIVGLFRRSVLEGIWRGQADWLLNERDILVETAFAGHVLYVDDLLFVKHTSPRSYVARNPSDPTVSRRRLIQNSPRRHALRVCLHLLTSRQVPALRKLMVPVVLPFLLLRRFGFRKPKAQPAVAANSRV